MKMWILLLGALILSIVAIWGCNMFVETPQATEKAAEQVSNHSVSGYTGLGN